MARLTLRITGRELPGRACGCFQEVHVAPQLGRVFKVPPARRRPARTLAALSDHPSTSSTGETLRLA
ncbi:hypothetical protein ACFU76_23605, partial [Streptomyces sp. NPDC057539]